MKRFVPVARTVDVPAGEARTFEVDGRSVLLCNHEGSFYAIDDLCTHDDGPLSDGRLLGPAIRCPRHGARFDVRTGAVLRMPAVTPIGTHPPRVVDGEVQVEIDG